MPSHTIVSLSLAVLCWRKSSCVSPHMVSVFNCSTLLSSLVPLILQNAVLQNSHFQIFLTVFPHNCFFHCLQLPLNLCHGNTGVHENCQCGRFQQNLKTGESQEDWFWFNANVSYWWLPRGSRGLSENSLHPELPAVAACCGGSELYNPCIWRRFHLITTTPAYMETISPDNSRENESQQPELPLRPPYTLLLLLTLLVLSIVTYLVAALLKMF